MKVGGTLFFCLSICISPSRFLRRLGPVHRLELPLCTGMVMVTLVAGPPTAGG